LDGKRPISERKLLANRANAQRSTGPRTQSGKEVSRRNALKHGILSRSLDLPSAITEVDVSVLKLGGPLGAGTDFAPGQISRIWDKMARVVMFEKECSQRPAGLEQNARLICRYERMLTRQLHVQIRECAGLDGKV
jgi:hypothetical protein